LVLPRHSPAKARQRGRPRTKVAWLHQGFNGWQQAARPDAQPELAPQPATHQARDVLYALRTEPQQAMVFVLSPFKNGTLLIFPILQRVLKSCMTDSKIATQLFESLASPVQLDIFKLLVKQGPGGLVAGKIASQLGLPATNLSFHLKNLTQTGLLSVEQKGRYQRYRADIPLILELISFLAHECCAGHPGLCLDFRAGSSCSPEVLPGHNLTK